MSPSATWGPASTLLFPDSIFCETRRVRSATGCHAMLIIVPRSILANLCGRTKEENVHVRISVAVHRDDGFASSAQQFVVPRFSYDLCQSGRRLLGFLSVCLGVPVSLTVVPRLEEGFPQQIAWTRLAEPPLGEPAGSREPYDVSDGCRSHRPSLTLSRAIVGERGRIDAIPMLGAAAAPEIPWPFRCSGHPSSTPPSLSVHNRLPRFPQNA